MIYHLIDTVKYPVAERRAPGHVWVDFRKYTPSDAAALVKDMIDSDNFLRVVIRHHNSHKNRLFHMFHITGAGRSFFLTDAVLNQFPTLDERLGFAVRAADWCLANNHMTPDDIVWFLNHSGHFNLKNKTACESELLVSGYGHVGKTACSCGQLDTALSATARKIKMGSDEKRDAKIIVVNDINEGNSLIKSFMLNNWSCMGFLIGTDIPVVVNSRFNLDMNNKTLELLGVEHEHD